MVKRITGWHKTGRIVGVAVLLALFALGLRGYRPAQAQATSRYFPETNHTVNEPFLSYWNNNGGLAQQGYPINDAVPEVNAADGKSYLTQYFERSRFELHPEIADPNFRVLLGLLGREAFLAKHPDGKVNSPSVVVPGGGSRTFPETGHTVTGLFLQYWNNNGGLRQQGYPITEAYVETNDADGKQYITQYFERARFEYHPEQPDARYKVLLGLVGREIFLRKQNGALPPTPPPSPGTPVPSPTQQGSACQIPVYQVFQYALDHNPDLKNQLGCAVDQGGGFESNVDAGFQQFRYGKLVIISPPTGTTYGYGLYPNGKYRRVETSRIPGSAGGPKDPGPHSSDAWGALGDLGIAAGEEDWGDGAVQNFQNGKLIYVGSQTQLVFAVFPSDAASGTWAQYNSRDK